MSFLFIVILCLFEQSNTDHNFTNIVKNTETLARSIYEGPIKHWYAYIKAFVFEKIFLKNFHFYSSKLYHDFIHLSNKFVSKMKRYITSRNYTIRKCTSPAKLPAKLLDVTFLKKYGVHKEINSVTSAVANKV